jgi:hypothetical protein
MVMVMVVVVVVVVVAVTTSYEYRTCGWRGIQWRAYCERAPPIHRARRNGMVAWVALNASEGQKESYAPRLVCIFCESLTGPEVDTAGDAYTTRHIVKARSTAKRGLRVIMTSTRVWINGSVGRVWYI